MATLGKWVKSCFESFVDPDKDAEVEELTLVLHKGLARHKQQFVLAEVLRDRPYKEKHLHEAKIALYHKFLTRAWEDGRVQPDELVILKWVARCLEFSPDTLLAVNLEYARPRFAEALARAMDDGEISSAEAATLTEIAAAAGLSLRQFVQAFFHAEGEAFLRGIFAAAVTENYLPDEALERIMATAGRLGLSRAEVLHAISAQAVRFIEHVLADAKEDGILTTAEDKALRSLLDKLDAPPETRGYVMAELCELGALTEIRKGKLPLLPAPDGLSLPAGELVHYHGPATWQRLKELKRGPSVTSYSGLLTITDCRLIFSSDALSESFSFSRIVGYDTGLSMLELHLRGNPAQRFLLDETTQVPVAIFSNALAMANQVLRGLDESRRSRHIPRDVRQRVWQRYGGRCAECGATSYLEFDHIIPVAKGGSNSDANVQLLCRRCNGKKAALI